MKKVKFIKREIYNCENCGKDIVVCDRCFNDLEEDIYCDLENSKHYCVKCFLRYYNESN